MPKCQSTKEKNLIAYDIRMSTKGLSVKVCSPWLEKLFSICAGNRYSTSNSASWGFADYWATIHHNYRGDTALYNFPSDIDSKKMHMLPSTLSTKAFKDKYSPYEDINIMLYRYGNRFKEIIEGNGGEKLTLNLSFLRTVGLSHGVAFEFKGVYSKFFIDNLAYALEFTANFLFKCYSHLIVWLPEYNTTDIKIKKVKLKEAKKFINLVGVELEGGWTSRPVAIKNWRGLMHDGSVSQQLYGHIGELRSSPMDSRSILLWTKQNMPDDTDDTCGFHVHMSLLNSQFYSRLMSNEFRNYVETKFRLWGDKHPTVGGAFWDRLNGNNRYCAGLNSSEHGSWHPDGQASTDEHYSSFRYFAVNFCRHLHSTVEFRFLPMWSKSDTSLAVSALKELINTVNSYLSNYREVPVRKIVACKKTKATEKHDYDQQVWPKMLAGPTMIVSSDTYERSANLFD
jgi:hypothetical protein